MADITSVYVNVDLCAFPLLGRFHTLNKYKHNVNLEEGIF